MQHKIYWGPLKKPLEWTLKTVLAPWSYLASVLYHDAFWYPTHQKVIRDILHSDWGRLFHNWESRQLPPDDLVTPGWADVGADPLDLKPETLKQLREAIRLAGMCVRESPELAARRRLRRGA
jgi:hypothetical protein